MSGYAFGKGVYFADMFAKSFNYCRINQYHHYNHDKKKKAPDNVGFLLLSEVALGKMNKIREAAYMEKAPEGTDSTKGMFLLFFWPWLAHFKLIVNLPTQERDNEDLTSVKPWCLIMALPYRSVNFPSFW